MHGCFPVLTLTVLRRLLHLFAIGAHLLLGARLLLVDDEELIIGKLVDAPATMQRVRGTTSRRMGVRTARGDAIGDLSV